MMKRTCVSTSDGTFIANETNRLLMSLHSLSPRRRNQPARRKVVVLKWFFKKALCFYEEPSPTEEPFCHLRHHYWLFEELFKEMFFKEPWFERFM